MCVNHSRCGKDGKIVACCDDDWLPESIKADDDDDQSHLARVRAGGPVNVLV